MTYERYGIKLDEYFTTFQDFPDKAAVIIIICRCVRFKRSLNGVNTCYMIESFIHCVFNESICIEYT